MDQHTEKLREEFSSAREALKNQAVSAVGAVAAGEPVNQMPHPADVIAPMDPRRVLDTVGRGQYRVSLAEQAAKSAAYHREVAEKHQQAGTFFAQHPEFEHFINLIRSGAISLYD